MRIGGKFGGVLGFHNVRGRGGEKRGGLNSVRVAD